MLVSVLGAGIGILGFPTLLEDPEKVRLEEENRRLQLEQETLERVVGRLTGERRVAQLLVVDQPARPDGTVETVIKFQEFDCDGNPLAVREFQVAGEVVYFDALLIKFDDQFVGESDLLRGKSLVLFRRIFGESQTPEEGFPIDPVRQIPEIYRTASAPTGYEERLWDRFWEYATDPTAAAEAGVRVAQGEAVYNQLQKGQFWVLAIENDGGLNLVRHDIPAVVTEHLLTSTPSTESP